MPRTVLIADPDGDSRRRRAHTAREAGYRVLNAQTPLEVAGALDACPIAAVVIDEDLLRHCDLGGLLLRAQVLILSKNRCAPMAQDVALISTDASAAEFVAALISVTGDPCYRGAREVIPIAARAVLMVANGRPFETSASSPPG